MKKIRNVCIKCEAEKLDELLDLLKVDYVEEIMITRTPEEFIEDCYPHLLEDYQSYGIFGLLDELEDKIIK